MKNIERGILIVAVVLITADAIANNPFSFTGVSVTDEGAITLSWQSETNTYYELQYANDLIDTNTGLTAWMPLYTEYPSHGTNTFIGDYGSYNETPVVPHPHNAANRFYRVVNMGTNTSAANPSISIDSPTNGATLSGFISVSVSVASTQIISSVKLYVDGQEMNPPTAGTNFVINTCEWGNGPHVLFATAKSQSAYEGYIYGDPVTSGRSVSAYKNVTFDNLISRFAFSEWFFKPSLGQTQKVSASFAANVNWALTIQDLQTNVVRTETGSGSSMAFYWDGTGQGSTNIPAGRYTYILSAYTNGGAFNGAMEEAFQLESLSALQAESASPDWYPKTPAQARAAGWNSYFVEMPPLPPYKSNGVWVTREPEAPREIPLPNLESLSSASAASLSYSGSEPAAAMMDAGTPTTQTTSGPNRPPTVGIKDPVGNFGVAWQTYPGGFTAPGIPNHRQFAPFFVTVDGGYTSSEPFPEVMDSTLVANNFVGAMVKGGYDPQYILKTSLFKPNHLTNGTISSARVAMVMLHSSYATTLEMNSSVYHIYQRFYDYYGDKSVSFVRLGDCRFGGSGANGLKWLALCECNAMRDNNWDSMKYANPGKLPFNNNMHVIVGASTFMTAAPNLGALWASNMLNGLTVKNAWIAAGHTAYTEETNKNLTITFCAAGWPNCIDDSITDYNGTPDSSGGQVNITKVPEDVYYSP